MHKWIALASGFALMAFELVAARLLAPTIGSSTFIWTNVIGVIMGALALGYWLGGRLADKRKRDLDVALLCLAAATLVILVLIFHFPIIDFARSLSSDARWQGLFAALLLFAPTSIIIGMLSPYLAKLALTSTSKTGETVARLSTWNAIGSISGTFITGFILFGMIGSRTTLAIVATIMLVANWLVVPRTKLWPRVTVSILLLLSTIITLCSTEAHVISIDTATANYRITKGIVNDRPITNLSSGPKGVQSSVYDTGDKNLVFWYTREIASVIRHHSTTHPPENILIIGGGAFTLPEHLGIAYPDAQVDVVEIDPELESIAREYFRFEKPSNVTVYAEDARSYINRINGVLYDAIVVDIFSDTDIPWQFVTREFGDKVASLLSEKGIVVVNSISAPIDGCSDIFEAEVATYSERLPYAYVKNQRLRSTSMTNRELVFSRTDLSLPDSYQSIDATSLRAYHDDYAPIEHLWQKCISASAS